MVWVGVLNQRDLFGVLESISMVGQFADANATAAALRAGLEERLAAVADRMAAAPARTLVLDCLTLLVSNLLLARGDADEAEAGRWIGDEFDWDAPTSGWRRAPTASTSWSPASRSS